MTVVSTEPSTALFNDTERRSIHVPSIRCKTCGKTTWAGCGQHIQTVKAGARAGQWCPGEHSKAEKGSAAGSGSGRGFFGKAFRQAVNETPVCLPTSAPRGNN